MKYFKGSRVKESKLRLLEGLYTELEDIAREEGSSLNLLVNKALEEYTLKYRKKRTNVNSSISPEVLFDDKQVKLLRGDFLKLDLTELKGRVNLIITSPPYNVGISYSSIGDSQNYEEYLDFTKKYLQRFYELLADDGRICLNIPLDKNKGGLRSVYSDVVSIAKGVGLNYQSTIIWNEQNISRRTAWGSWMSASAPYVIAPVEVIVLFYKRQWKRKTKGTTTISKKEFIEWTNGVWSFSGESKKKIGHPAPFPVELPLRCIKLFSYEEDLILDPFVGSGTTLIACELAGRKGVGIDIDEDYLNIAVRRIEEIRGNLFDVCCKDKSS